MAFYFTGSLKCGLFQKVESINITGDVGTDARNSRAPCCLGWGAAAAPVAHGLGNIAIGHLLEILSPLKI